MYCIDKVAVSNNYRFNEAWNLFFLFFSINVVLFTWQVASPLPQSDEWFFIDTFVRKIYDRSLGVSDFFYKRDAKDHSQPLHKLMLYAHVKLFNLDFKFDAFISMLSGLLTLRWLVFCLNGNAVLSSSDQHGQEIDRTVCLRYMTLMAIPLSLFSMNTIDAYVWALVGQFFITFPFIVWYMIGFSEAVERKSPRIGFFLSTALMVFLLDSLGLICVVSSLAYIALIAFKSRSYQYFSKLAFNILIITMFAKLAVLPLIPSFAGASATFSGFHRGIGYVVTNWHDLGYWLIIPAASSIMHKHWLQTMLGENFAELFFTILGILVLILHFWFWSVWWSSRENKLSTFSAVLMLYVYSSVVGIIFIRLPDFGLDYLNQGRYVPFCYQISILALLIQLWHCLSEKKGSLHLSLVRVSLVWALLIVYLGLQSVFIWKNWETAKRIRNHMNTQAEEMLRFSSIEDSGGLFTSPELYYYGGDIKAMGKVIDFLMKKKLNIYSNNFQYRYNWQQFDNTRKRASG